MATVGTQWYYRIVPINNVVHLFQTDVHSQEAAAKRSHEQSIDTTSEGGPFVPIDIYANVQQRHTRKSESWNGRHTLQTESEVLIAITNDAGTDDGATKR